MCTRSAALYEGGLSLGIALGEAPESRPCSVAGRITLSDTQLPALSASTFSGI